MATAFLDDGQLHFVAGQVTAGTAPTITTNDGSVTVARATATEAGIYTVTFGAAFLSAPTVVASVVDDAFSTDEVQSVAVQSVATNSVTFDVITTTVTGATATNIAAANADLDFTFMAVGARNR